MFIIIPFVMSFPFDTPVHMKFKEDGKFISLSGSLLSVGSPSSVSVSNNVFYVNGKQICFDKTPAVCAVGENIDIAINTDNTVSVVKGKGLTKKCLKLTKQGQITMESCILSKGKRMKLEYQKVNLAGKDEKKNSSSSDSCSSSDDNKNKPTPPANPNQCNPSNPPNPSYPYYPPQTQYYPTASPNPNYMGQPNYQSTNCMPINQPKRVMC